MDRSVAAAMRAIPRARFLPPDVAHQADADAPLPIGFGQTNSQPTTVAMMLDWLAVEPGNHILDVGSGSGWTTALLAWLAGPNGEVVAVEAIPELVDFGRDNCARLGIRNVGFHLAGDMLGYPAGGPYDRILVSAATTEVPAELTNQLAPEGTMVIPVRSDVLTIAKQPDGSLDTVSHPGFVFVPLV